MTPSAVPTTSSPSAVPTTSSPSAVPTSFRPTIIDPSTLTYDQFTKFTDIKDKLNVSITAKAVQRVPRFFDWNRDGLLDILVGSAGTILVHINKGTVKSPIFTRMAVTVRPSIQTKVGRRLLCMTCTVVE
mmetsp:Transcript_32986/g.47669  ORF Transcript_32986/g.47669 Transcript_32986/m.47669 type:complete len:130 (+) Transcript_32986:449-838(+)